jgi:NADH-quinone oxidoreductase subunit F
MMPRIEDIGVFNAVRESGMCKLTPTVPRIAVGMGTCGRGNGAEGLFHGLAEAIVNSGSTFYLTQVGCFGACCHEPLVNIRIPGQPLLILHHVQASDATRIIHDLVAGHVTPDLVYCKVEEWDHITGLIRYGYGFPEIPAWNEVPFFKGQKKIVLRNCGIINPEDVDEYIAVGGYQALYKALIDAKPEIIIEQIKAAKLRGRGGAGFPTGKKMGISPQGGFRPEVHYL